MQRVLLLAVFLLSCGGKQKATEPTEASPGDGDQAVDPNVETHDPKVKTYDAPGDTIVGDPILPPCDHPPCVAADPDEGGEATEPDEDEDPI